MTHVGYKTLKYVALNLYRPTNYVDPDRCRVAVCPRKNILIGLKSGTQRIYCTVLISVYEYPQRRDYF